jgi:hypothetical protein
MEMNAKTTMWRTGVIATAGTILGVIAAACGSGGPSAPIATPTTAPTPAPSPVAQATPTPEPTPEGEPPVTRTDPPVRITLRFYNVETPGGSLVEYRTTDDGTPIVPIPYIFRLDAVAKNAKNKETMGDGKVQWHFSDEGLIQVVNDSNPFHLGFRAVRQGTLSVYVSMDGGKETHEIDSNVVAVELRP